jgi:hypothetical protein
LEVFESPMIGRSASNVHDTRAVLRVSANTFPFVAEYLAIQSLLLTMTTPFKPSADPRAPSLVDSSQTVLDET